MAGLAGAPAAGAVGTGAGTEAGAEAGVGAVVEAAGVDPGMVSLTGAGTAEAGTASSTLPADSGRKLPKYAKAKVVTKKMAASTEVVRDKKLAPPVAPNKLPDVPLPKAAPMSAPLPC